jgi:hypothetical protein
MIAIARAAEAGWTSDAGGLQGGGEAILTFSRYVGIGNPDAETQARHLMTLKCALAADGLDFDEMSSGVVVDGQTHPVLATAQLVQASTSEGREQLESRAWAGTGLGSVDGVDFAGTCFAFRHTNVFMTAAHCVHGLTPDVLLVVTPTFPGGAHRVVRITRHATADIAVLELDPDEWPAVEPFVTIGSIPPLGADFMAYGFPEDAPAPSQLRREPVQRLFRGYIQRTLQYELGAYKYRAAEMSVPSPQGLSGGPLFTPSNQSEVMGVATQNVESMTFVGRREEVVDGDTTYKSTDIHHVQYGIATLIAPVTPWIDEIVRTHRRMPASAELT